MQIENMLAESVQLLILGMGSVFFILLLLIACLSFMSSLIPAPVESNETTTKQAKAETSNVMGSSIVAAIQAAVHSYRASPNR